MTQSSANEQRPQSAAARGLVSIREATPEDATAIFEVTRRSVAGLCRGHYTDRQVECWMGDRTPATYLPAIDAGRIRVATVAGEVVGYVDAVPGEVCRLFILPDHAAAGLGARLMRIGLAMAEPAGGGPVRVEATRNAEPFYRKFGFTRIGEGCFAGRGDGFPPIETVIMRRP
jgi:predicted N-acetyltransferase YhbS